MEVVRPPRPPSVYSNQVLSQVLQFGNKCRSATKFLVFAEKKQKRGGNAISQERQRCRSGVWQVSVGLRVKPLRFEAFCVHGLHPANSHQSERPKHIGQRSCWPLCSCEPPLSFSITASAAGSRSTSCTRRALVPNTSLQPL